MSQEGSLKFDYKVADEVAKRLHTLFKGLPEEGVRAALEELIDDYCMATFGIDVLGELRNVKLPGKGNSRTIQTLANGRAILVSSYGFNVKTDTKCRCGRAFIVLDEKKREDMEREMSNMG
jgi:hypothetical protein